MSNERMLANAMMQSTDKLCRLASLNAEIEAMKAENDDRKHKGLSIAYTEESFLARSQDALRLVLEGWHL